MTYKVVERKGWSYVEAEPSSELTKPVWIGPWRYRWEAQEEADRLNRLIPAKATQP